MALRYCLGYDFVFLARKPFLYKNENIGSLSLDVLFHVFDKKGNEVFFQNEDECIDQPLFKRKDENGELKNIYLCDLVQCSYDEEDDFTFNLMSSMKGFPYAQLTFEVVRFYKDRVNGCMYYPTEISEAEFRTIIKEHPKNFKNSNNISAQTTAYFTKIV